MNFEQISTRVSELLVRLQSEPEKNDTIAAIQINFRAAGEISIFKTNNDEYLIQRFSGSNHFTNNFGSRCPTVQEIEEVYAFLVNPKLHDVDYYHHAEIESFVQ